MRQSMLFPNKDPCPRRRRIAAMKKSWQRERWSRLGWRGCPRQRRRRRAAGRIAPPFAAGRIEQQILHGSAGARAMAERAPSCLSPAAVR